jgi:hypothetical protein
MADDLHVRETEVARLTVAENPEEARLCDTVFAPLWEGFDALKHQIKVAPVGIETVQLLAMALNALRWSHEQLLKGYYSPAVSMARTAWECWLTGAYLNLYPERLEEWKRYETRPKPWQMRTLVAERTEEDEADRSAFLDAMKDLYNGADGQRFSGYSVLSHPSWEAIRILVKSEGDEYSLRVGPDYDQHLFLLALDSFCTAAMLAASLFPYLLEGAEQEAFVKRLDEVKGPLRAWRRRQAPP